MINSNINLCFSLGLPVRAGLVKGPPLMGLNVFSKLGILVKIDFTPFEFPTYFLRRVFDLLPLLNLPGRSVIPCYCLMLGQTRARLSPPPAFFSLPALMQARRRDRQSGKKRKIDSLDEIKFSSQMTVSPSGPPYHTPRAIIVGSFLFV